MSTAPTAPELADAIARWIAGLPLEGRAKYEARVAAGLLSTLGRETVAGQAARAGEAERERVLLGHEAGAGELARLIREGGIDVRDGRLLDHLIRTTLDRIAIDQPRYAHRLAPRPTLEPRGPGLVEVSPRDGLQNQPTVLPVADRVELVVRAAQTGARRIEVASFVDPRRVPQMADAEALIAALPDTGAQHVGLVLNVRGAERALATRVHQLGVVIAATDAFGRRNQGQGVENGLAMAAEVFARSRRAGRSAQATIAVAFGCPFDGAVDPDGVVALARALVEAGAEEVALADSIGVARPAQVTSLFKRLGTALGDVPSRAHFHDTRGMGVANSLAAAAAGAASIDASLAGTGGCPFAPGAAGNVATEDLAFAFGDRLGIDLAASIEAARWLDERLDRPSSSALARAPEWKETWDGIA